jgi:hypothetical protein
MLNFGKLAEYRRPLKAGRKLAGLGWRGSKAAGRGAGRFALSSAGSRFIVGGAIAAGIGASAFETATHPDVQEALTGLPDAYYAPGRGVSQLTRGYASAVFLGNYNPNDLNNPRAALERGGDVYAAPSYLYGNAIAGDYMGNISGSRVMGGFNTQSRGRIMGAPQRRSSDNRIADGSMVFGMWHARR